MRQDKTLCNIKVMNCVHLIFISSSLSLPSVSVSTSALSRESEVSNVLVNERRAWSGDKQLLRGENKQLETKVAGLSKRLGEELARAKKLDTK